MDPFDFDRFFDPAQRFIAVTTNCRTGQTAFFEKGKCSDIFRAVQQGAASVMLTGETAAGKYPVEAMEYMVNTVRDAEAYLYP